MGAYLNFRVCESENAPVANDILRGEDEWHELVDNDCPAPSFWTVSDEEETDWWHLSPGEGQVKVNSVTPPGGRERFRECVTHLFDVLHDNERVDVEVYAGSCAFGEQLSGDGFAYFSAGEVARICDGGRVLTDDADTVLRRLPPEMCEVERGGPPGPV